MKTYNVILGVDVSKLTLDISCAERLLHIKIDNNSKGFGIFKKWCKTNGIDLKEVLVIMEHTGGYEYRFIQFCQSLAIDYRRVPGLEIKNSMGMVRGKDDNMLKFKHLLSFRKRLVRETAGLEATVGERKHMYELKKKDTITSIAMKKIAANKKYSLEVEKEIMELIRADEAMLLNYRILTSIKGIGPINAWMALAYTENFTLFTDARKYAVYVGVIPFN